MSRKTRGQVSGFARAASIAMLGHSRFVYSAKQPLSCLFLYSALVLTHPFLLTLWRGNSVQLVLLPRPLEFPFLGDIKITIQAKRVPYRYLSQLLRLRRVRKWHFHDGGPLPELSYFLRGGRGVQMFR